MNRKTLVMALLATLLAGCGDNPDTKGGKPPPKTWQLPLIAVAIGAPVEYSGIGSVVSDQRIDIASRLSGYIRELRVQEGDRVQAGQVLARIDAADVEGGIRQAQAALSTAEAALKDARIDVDRFRSLFEKGNVSDSEMRKVQLRHDAAQEMLNQARAGLETAQAQREYAEIRSPIEGVIVARAQRAGDLAVPGVPILTLESGRGLVFETFVAGQQVVHIVVGKPVTVRIDGIDAPLQGKVSRVVRSGDPVTRSYPVKIALPETRGLMPGMFGRADFVLGEAAVLVLPTRVLVERGGLRGVFIVDAAGRARFRWLRLGREWPDRVEVTAGLRAGERVVDAVEPALRDGDAVTPLPADNPPGKPGGSRS